MKRKTAGRGIQYERLYGLWQAYLHMMTWGTPEYDRLDNESREDFRYLVSDGGLFRVVEDGKRHVVETLPDIPDSWLAPLSAGRVKNGEPLPVEDRDQLADILREIHARLVRLDPRFGEAESEADRADSKTDNLGKIPENPDVLKLAKEIRRRGSKNDCPTDIARAFTDFDEKSAQSLLRQLRRFPHLLD